MRSLTKKSAVVVRPVQAGDVERLTEMHLRLSPGDCHQRYLAARGFTPETARAEAERIAAGRTSRHIAMVAIESRPGSHDLVGVAELVRLDEEDSVGELAIVVHNDMQGIGIGSLLIQELVTAAPISDLRVIKIDVLAENTAMRRLAAHLGPATIKWLGDGVLQLRIELRAAPKGMLSRVSRLWAARRQKVA